MKNHLGNYFRDLRCELGLSLGQLARLVGYRNVSKGANKICRFERDGVVTEELLANLAEALSIDLLIVEGLMEQDRQERFLEWEAWVNEPVPMFLIVRHMPAVYARKPLPASITTHEQAEAFACNYAREHRMKVCLALSRRHSGIDSGGQVEFQTEATPEDQNVPYMRLRNRRRFLLDGTDSR